MKKSKLSYFALKAGPLGAISLKDILCTNLNIYTFVSCVLGPRQEMFWILHYNRTK